MGRRIHDRIVDNNDLHHDCKYETRGAITQTDSDRGMLCPSSKMRQALADMTAANIWLLARLLHFVQPTNICLVALGSSHTSQHLLVASQCDRLDETSTFFEQNGQQDIYWNGNSRNPILDYRDLREFCLFPQHQRPVPADEALGSTMSGSLVDCCSRVPHIQHKAEV